MNLRHLILASATLALFGADIPPAHADTIIVGQLFVADYGKSVLDRYQYTFDQTLDTITNIRPNGIGGNTTNAYFLGNVSTEPIKEGVQGTSNDLIVVVGAHGSTATTLQRYTLDGSFIGNIPVNFSAYNGGNVGIGNVAITPDGRYEYAPLETAGVIVKIDLSNGKIVHTFNFASAHDVAIAANGDVYAADYAAGSPEVIRLDSNLGFIQTLVTASPNGVSAPFHPTGLAIAADGSLYVENNDRTASNAYDSVFHYTFTNNAGTLTANFDGTHSYIGSATNNALEFTFGNNIGPDGRIYIADLGGGGGGFNIPSGYVDGIDAFNPLTQTVTQVIAGYTEKSGPVGASGLDAPKYLQFDINFVKSPDAGVPEPGTIALLLAGFAGLAVLKSVQRRNS